MTESGIWGKTERAETDDTGRVETDNTGRAFPVSGAWQSRSGNHRRPSWPGRQGRTGRESEEYRGIHGRGRTCERS